MGTTLVRVALAASLLVIVLGAPAASGAEDVSEEIEKLTEAISKVRGAAANLTELARIQVDAGRIDEVVRTMERLRDLLDSYSELSRYLAELKREAGVAEPILLPEEPLPPDDLPVPKPSKRIGIGGGAGGGAGGPVGGRRARRNLVPLGGGTVTESSVDLALKWLKYHQDPAGHWDSDGFDKQCKLNKCDGAGYALYDVGVTGLAIQAFLGAGETHKAGKHRMTVATGLGYLKKVQDAEGCFGPRTTNHFTYQHAVATQAVVEAYSLTASPLFKQSAQMGVDFILKAQNPYLAWRYGVRPQDNDTSVTGWMVSALYAAKQAGLRVDQTGFDGAKAWLEKVTEPEYGRIGYTARGTGPARPQALMDKFPSDRSESLTAEGILIRIHTGENPRKSEMIQKGMDLLLKVRPQWDETSGDIDMYYWYWGTQAAFQVGGESWKKWNTAMKAAVIDHQRKDGDEKGSWDPLGPWGPDGGRVYSTALCTMMLEVYYRHGRIFSSAFGQRK